MKQFKVGDKVIVKPFGNVKNHFGIARHRWKEYENKEFVIDGFSPSGSVLLKGDRYFFSWPHNAFILTNAKRIVICQDGTTTRAIEYEGKRRVKEAIAKLHPDDEYMWETGRDLALNRLIYGTDYHPSEVAFQEEEKPLYNGKVVCVDHNVLNQDDYTVGRIYQFRDGSIINDRGHEVPYYKESKVHSFDEWVRFSGSKWIEIVE